MSEQLKVTSPEEYAALSQEARGKEDKGFLHKLKKTGAVVRLRHVDMEALAMVGALPMSLVALVTGGGNLKVEDMTPEQLEDGAKALVMMRMMVVENCLEPAIRHEEGVGVFFVGSNGKPAARVDKDDFKEMFAVISGQEGNDGLERFPNRHARRASTRKSRGGKVRPQPVLASPEK
jgi:hypothetical protein